MQNREQLRAALIQEISAALSQRTGTNIVNTLYEEFAKEAEQRIQHFTNINNIYFDTLETIAKLYGLTFSQSFELSSIHKNTTALVKQIDTLAKTTRPRQRFLSFCISDDYGHTNCFVVAEKDKEFVDLVFATHENLPLYEYIHEESQIILGLSARHNKSPDDLFELDNKVLYDMIVTFFDEIINDDTVTVEQFSEYLASLINESRNSGNGFAWVHL